MNITDNRFKKQELSFDELEAGKVYVSHKLQKYVMASMPWGNDSLLLMCLETGEIFAEDGCDGAGFEPVKATLVVE